MRISDWSSDVCSSDLGVHHDGRGASAGRREAVGPAGRGRSRQISGCDERERASVAGVRDVQSLDGRHGAVGEAPGGAGIQIGSGRGEGADRGGQGRSEEHTSELQSLMRISYAVLCLKKKKEEEKESTIYQE